MGKHNDKEFHDKLQMSFRYRLEEQFKRGLLQGSYAITKVVYDRATDENKTVDERLENIIAFCKTGLGLNAAAAAIENTEQKVAE